MSENRTYDVLIKPVGDLCNLRCRYCYYSGKGKTLEQKAGIMSCDTLCRIIKDVIDMHGRDAVIRFNWHGGEPILAGIDFFKQVIRLQKKYAAESGKEGRIINTIQTNGTTLTEEWCRFLKEQDFQAGISIDGPGKLHNLFRRRCSGDASEGSYDMAMAGLKLLQKFRVPYSVLTTVNSANVKEPEALYHFLKEITGSVQFLPVVEALPAQYEKDRGQTLATPPGIHSVFIKHPLTDASVNAREYGDFLCRIYEAWEKDGRKLRIQLFDVIHEQMDGKICSLCTMDLVCGHSICVEADGRVYSCDRYAFPEYCIGDVYEENLGAIAEHNRDFGMAKALTLPEECLECEFIRICGGGCPKDRLLMTEERGKQKSALCEGYQMIFQKILHHV